MISVLIPAWNEEQHIRDCIESVVEQDTDHEYELIVVDDNSTDSTPEKLQILSRRHDITILTNDKNRGVLGSTQRAYSESSGEFVLRLDADSTLKPGSIDAIHRELQAYDIVYGKVYVSNTDKLHPAACAVGKERGNGSYYGAGCVALRREIVKNFGGFDNLRQNVEIEVINLAPKHGWTVQKTPDVAIDSAFPESIREWLPRKLTSGAIYLRECADNPSEFKPLELRGPLFWTVTLGIGVVQPLLALLLVTILFTLHWEDAKQVAIVSGKARHLWAYPLYKMVGGVARTAGVIRESPLLLNILRRKYA